MDLMHAEKVNWNRNEAVRISKRHASGLNRELPQPIGSFRTQSCHDTNPFAANQPQIGQGFRDQLDSQRT